MLFNSLHYLIFFVVVVVGYFALSPKLRIWLLLASGLYFYMVWKPVYIVLILFTSVITYISAYLTDRAKEKSRKKLIMVLCLVVNLGVLFVFKYFNLFNDIFGDIAQMWGGGKLLPDFTLLLPVGISFYTFQTLSYCIDVYRGTSPVEKNFGVFLLYVTFFPQLVAGPIERSDKLLPQLKQTHALDASRMADGLRMMAFGYIKKMVIADQISSVVDSVYNNVPDSNGFQFICATLLFSVQIYCDFSGYSDIAIGSAKILGVDLMTNFKRPYFSKSIAEFWKRWHISLSTWFKDYFYIPMGGNRVSPFRHSLNIFLTFLLSGLWHGANLTFVIWGALHGLYQIIGRKTMPWRNRLFGSNKKTAWTKLRQIAVTYILVCFAWIFFRANTVGDAFNVISSMVRDIPRYINPSFIVSSLTGMGLAPSKLMFVVFIIGFLLFTSIVTRERSINECVKALKPPVRWLVYFAVVFMLVFLRGVGNQNFIYFQF